MNSNNEPASPPPKNGQEKANSHRGSALSSKQIAVLTLGALGVVYGDIGTSPLYALKVTLSGYTLSSLNIFGVLSLIFWTLIVIISIKYLLVILKADNQGEGGILALLALLKGRSKKWIKPILLLTVIGAGLLLGDGMLTPAISVLSAVEGLNLISPHLNHLILPFTLGILVLLFWHQKYGTGKIGQFFGPIILFWFFTMGILGLHHIIRHPIILLALNPWYGIEFFIHHGNHALSILGGVFLVITGGEAMYADLGHFGKLPIRLGWFAFALPALVLNYFGQGALLLIHPESITNPFYSLAPNWFQYPLLILATIASIIASQAIISATFSLSRQAILLDLIPETNIVQTSEQYQGQIYVPKMNLIIAIGTILFVLIFQHSINLAHLYGIAINLDMLLASILVPWVAREKWGWSKTTVALVFGAFFIIDSLFMSSNLLKIAQGGWIPLTIATLVGLTMLTWNRGTQILREMFYSNRIELSQMIGHLQKSTRIHPIPGLTAIFITDPADTSGGGLMHYLKLNHSLPESVIILSVRIEDKPYIVDRDRCEYVKLHEDFHKIILHYGFMQNINIPDALDEIDKRSELPFKINSKEMTFFTETKNLVFTNRKHAFFTQWQKRLFGYLQRNSLPSPEFYHLPVNRTIAIGVYCPL